MKFTCWTFILVLLLLSSCSVSEKQTSANKDKQILIKKENEAIGITIEDNGIGYHPDNPTDRKKGAGSGLKMLRQTIELLNAKKSDKISFRIENKSDETPPGQGTCVYLHIPIHYNFEL